MQKQRHETASRWSNYANNCPSLPSLDSCRVVVLIVDIVIPFVSQRLRYGNRINLHSGETSQQKCRRKPLSVHLSVKPIRLLIDPISLQAFRQLFIGHSSLAHFGHEQSLGEILPWRVISVLRQCHRINPCIKESNSLKGISPENQKLWGISTIFGLIRPKCLFRLASLPIPTNQKFI
jgi:hypothetical protein